MGGARFAALLCAAIGLAALPGCGDPPPSRPAARFVQRGVASGLDFVLDHGGNGQKFFPEIMVGGVSLFDYDGDGDLDVWFAQGALLPGRSGAPLQDRLYRNDGDLRFSDVTTETGASEAGYSFSAACPDIDGDGDLDLYLCNYGRNTLLVNDGHGHFLDVTESSGLGSRSWSMVASFVDLDRDGDLDVYVGNYVVYDVATVAPCGNPEGGELARVYCHPDSFPGARDDLFRNDGGRDRDVHFTDVTEQAGAGGATGKALAIVPFDYDGDGDVDLFVANDHVPNFLWRNDSAAGGPIQLREVGEELGVARDGEGKSESCMGSDVGDVDGDGDFDLFSANMAKETNTLWVNDGPYFNDDTDIAGLGRESLMWVGFGAKLFDADLDGDVDLALVNGHVLDTIERLDPHQTFAQQAQLYENRGRGKFTLISERGGPYFEERHVGRGLAAGDLDNDGDVDLVVTHWQERPELLENSAIWDGSGPQWIGLELHAKGANTRAIGARVTCTSGDLRQLDEVRGSGSYVAWNDTRLLFGLGDRRDPVAITIRWPDGSVEERNGLLPGKYHAIAQR